MKKKLISILLLGSIGLSLIGCNEPTEAQKSIQRQDIKKQEQAGRMMENTKVPEFTESVDRENIVGRLVLTNSPLTIGWVYPMSNGRVLGRFPVRGKVTSGSKRLTNTEMYTYVSIPNKSNDSNFSYERMQSPDEMGTYGTSNPYIFWFDPSGNYFQHQGDYFYSTMPYKIDLGMGTLQTEIIDTQENAKLDKYNQEAKVSYEIFKKKIGVDK